MVASVAIVLQGLLPALAAVPATPVYAEGATVGVRATVRVRTVSTSMSLDTSSNTGGTDKCTAIENGPVITESSIGALATSTIITLTAPTGFKFCTPSASGTLALIDTAAGGSTDMKFSNGKAFVTPTLSTVSNTNDTLTVTIGTAGTSGPAKVSFSALSVVPTTNIPATGSISVTVSTETGVTKDAGGTLSSVVGDPASVAFTTQPAGTKAGTLSTQPVVKVYDRFGNQRTGSDAVVMSLQSHASGAALSSCSNTIVSGVITFSGCSIDKSGDAFYLQATYTTASGASIFALSNSFNLGAVAPTVASVKATSGTNSANSISNASKGAVSVDVTFPSGGPAETGTVNVSLTDANGSTVTGSTSVTSGSTSSTSYTVSRINASGLADGAVTVKAYFVGGATSATLTGTAATKDTVAPVPGTLTLDSASDTGTLSSDKVTKVATPTFNLADASDTGSGLASVQLQVSTDSGANWTATGSAVTTGLTSPTALTAGPLGAGTYSVRAKVTDIAGNSEVTGTVTGVVIDTNVPTVSVIGATGTTADGTKKIGDTVDVTVTFSEAVYVAGTGALGLTLETGATDRVATYQSGSGTATLTFQYTVVEGDVASDLNATALALSGTATLTDTAGNSAVLTLPGATLASTHAIVIDGVRPRLSTITRAASASQVTNGTSSPTYTVTFSEAVLGVSSSNFVAKTGASVTGTPSISVTSSGSATATWTVTFGLTSVSGAGDATSTLELVLADPSGISDANLNAMTSVYPTGSSAETYVLDNVNATITGVTATTADGSYNASDVIDITVTFSEAVTVTGTPVLALTSGGSAAFASGSGST
ncbi:MAG: hypothetical protein EBT09_06355, partial [Actinobacteria bacterium]|nr:hypothetical protein [Actinomycetota bacterium]